MNAIETFKAAVEASNKSYDCNSGLRAAAQILAAAIILPALPAGTTEEQARKNMVNKCCANVFHGPAGLINCAEKFGIR